MKLVVCERCGDPIERALLLRSGKSLWLDAGLFTLGNLDVVEYRSVDVRRRRIVPVVRLVPRAELEARRAADDAFRQEHICPL